MKKDNLPKIKKDLKNFLTNEEGRIAEKNIKNISLTVVALGAAAAGLMKPDSSLAAPICSHSVHGVHFQHTVHSVHSDHSHGGWC
jgi:hypothetical protein